MDKAACKGIPVAVKNRYFYPGSSGRPAPEGAYDYARDTWCGRCPVTQECLDFALSVNEKWGIWGGLSPEQRRVLVNGPIKHGTLTGYRQHYECNTKPCDECHNHRRAYDAGRKAS